MAELPRPQVSPEEARETADRVLSGRAYQQAARGPSLRERFFDWLGDLISDAFESLSTTGGRGLIAWVIIAIFGAAIAFLVFKLLQGIGPMPERQVKPDPTVEIAADRSAKQWLDRAMAAEADGDWRVGIRSRHRALVAEFIDREIVTTRPGQTAGEIQLTVASRFAPLAEPMRDLTWLFNDVWYGRTEAGVVERDRFVELSDAVLAGISETGALVTAGQSAP